MSSPTGRWNDLSLDQVLSFVIHILTVSALPGSQAGGEFQRHSAFPACETVVGSPATLRFANASNKRLTESHGSDMLILRIEINKTIVPNARLLGRSIQ